MHKMRRSDRQMAEQEIYELLESSDIIRIGVIAEEKPYIVPVNFICLNDVIYFHSAKAGRKVTALEEAGEVCFEVDELIAIKHEDKACKFSCYYKSIIGYGQPFSVDGPEKADILNSLTQKYTTKKFEPVSAGDAQHVVVYGIKITSVCGKKNIPH